MTTRTEPRDVSSRRVLLIRTAPAVVEPEGRGLRFSGTGFEGLRTPGSAPWFDGHPPPSPVGGPSSDREIGRLTNAFWEPRAAGVLGTLALFPGGVTSAADRHRGLISSGSDRLSIRYYPIGDNAQVRANDGVVDVLRWGISHVASVGEPADVSAGDELGSADGYDLEVDIHWIDMEGDMTQPNFDLNSVLPDLTAAIAAGVRQGNAPTDTGAQAPEQMTAMLKIASSQPELYQPGALQELGFDLVLGKFANAEAFRDKLTSIQILHRPIGSGLSDPADAPYNLGAIMQGVLSGDFSDAGVELARSNDIKKASDLSGRLSAATVAIPRNLVSHSGDSGTGAAGTAIREVQGAFYDVGTPDSTDVVQFLTRLPGGPGLVKANAITLPQPTHTPEPTTDAGYPKTGDASAAGNELAPSILVDYLNATRLLNTIEPDYWDAVLQIVERRFSEQMNRGLVVGDGVNSPLENGMYGLAGVGSSANLSAAITTAIVESALSASVHVAGPDANRAIITTETNVATMRSLAQPAAVSALMAQTTSANGTDQVRDAKVFSCGFFPAGKTRRGVAGPWADVLLKQWDDSLYISRRDEAGISWLLVEMFWTVHVRHPALFHRFRED